jgi:hypothetical protein
MDDELEPEILSYREFINRETLRAWEQRRRAVESPPGSPRDLPRPDGDPPRRHGESRGDFGSGRRDARR